VPGITFFVRVVVLDPPIMRHGIENQNENQLRQVRLAVVDGTVDGTGAGWRRCDAQGGVADRRNGGRGSVLGTVLGCLIIGMLNNGLVLLDVSPFLAAGHPGGRHPDGCGDR
jgi:hypothetical protein